MAADAKAVQLRRIKRKKAEVILVHSAIPSVYILIYLIYSNMVVFDLEQI